MSYQLGLFEEGYILDADRFITLCERITSGIDIVAKYAHLLDDRSCGEMFNELLKHGFTEEELVDIINSNKF
jgi:hypothetical protein